MKKYIVTVTCNGAKYPLNFKGKDEADVQKQLEKSKFKYDSIFSIKLKDEVDIARHARGLFSLNNRPSQKRSRGGRLALYG